MSGTIIAINVKNVDPDAAWFALQSEPDAVLVDVRTAAEWAYVGLPNLDALAKKPILVEWQIFPSMAVNPDFISTLTSMLNEAGLTRSASLYFLCRSGVRSKAAAEAMIEAGWDRSFNILGGFEGGHDAARRRGTVAGWKASGLPWSQA